MIPPCFAADGGSGDQHGYNTSGQNADDGVESLVAVDELTVGLFLSDKLLFRFNSTLSLDSSVAKHDVGVWGEHDEEHHA